MLKVVLRRIQIAQLVALNSRSSGAVGMRPNYRK